MNSKIFLIGLLLMAVLSAGCIDFTVYPDYEEIHADSSQYTLYPTTVEDVELMGGSELDSGRFVPNELGMAHFENDANPITKTDTSTTFNLRFKVSDLSANGVGSNLIVNVHSDNGGVEQYTVSVPDYDGYIHWVIVSPAESFKWYDTNGDGRISADLIHESTDSNYVKVYAMKLRVNYDSAATPPPTTSTGNVEFYTDPIGSSVYVDGECKGTTMAYTYGVLTVPLSEGSHTWIIAKDGYNSKSGTVNVIADQTITVTETLTAVTSGEGDIGTPTPSNVAPSAVITAVQPSQSMVVFNSDKSTDSDGSIVKREWSLNGKVVTNAVQYQFSTSDKATGTYTVQLTVTDNGGATGTAQYIITLEGKTITETKDVTVPTISGDEVPEGATPTGIDDPLTFVLPGFESVFAIVGLIAVALLRRDR